MIYLTQIPYLTTGPDDVETIVDAGSLCTAEKDDDRELWHVSTITGVWIGTFTKDELDELESLNPEDQEI